MSIPIIDQLIEAKEKRGISTAELSRRSGVPYHKIRRAFNEGKSLRYSDTVALAEQLEIAIK